MMVPFYSCFLMLTSVVLAQSTFGQDTLAPPPKFAPVTLDSTKTYKDYFFDDRLDINDSTQLLIMVENAQTQMAADLGHRIYDDPAFLQMLKDTFYQERYVHGDIVAHFCGYDLYFYALVNGKLRYLRPLNSNCELSEIGCENLDILFQSGRPLRCDTLTSAVHDLDNIEKYFGPHFLFARYENRTEWIISRTVKYPTAYYEGHFRAMVPLDSAKTWNENIKDFVAQYTNQWEAVNWSTYDRPLRDPSEVEVYFYLKEEAFNDFSAFDVTPTSKKVPDYDRLFLFYLDAEEE